MRVHGVEITPEQIAAGLAAMVSTKWGYFGAWEVQYALRSAGVSNEYVGGPFAERRKSMASIFASRLLQQERKAGRIKQIGPGQWVRCEQ